MADNSFRTFRRDGIAGDNEPAQREGGFADPLAELARLIGQGEAHATASRDYSQSAEGFDETAPAEVDWSAADEEYAQQGHGADTSYAPPPADPYYSQPAREDSSHDNSGPREQSFEPEGRGAREYARSAPAYQNGSGDPRRNVQQDPYYRDEPRPAASRAEPSLYAPSTQSGGYQTDQQQRYGAQASAYQDDADYDRDRYDEEAPPPRRSGTIVIMALLGLAVLGTGGALAYRAIFGSPMIPSLPPIIKPSDTPIKIVPRRDAQSPGQTGVGTAGTGEQVVPHQEQPVDPQTQSANPVPRVVTTIPVISNTPNSSLPSAASPQSPGGPVATASPPAFADPNAAAPPGLPDQLVGSPGPPPAGSRPVQTIKIQPGQQTVVNTPDAAPAPQTRPAKPRPPVTRPVREAAPRQTPGGPLSIVPTQETGAPAPPPARVAMNRPTPLSSSSPEAAPTAAGGSYAVQVTSQRSEAEAQAAFRGLQAKFPRELGGHRAVFRRADLGAKGVYYRALVGPFASAEQATSLCNSLKAAGGSCLIQRN